MAIEKLYRVLHIESQKIMMVDYNWSDAYITLNEVEVEYDDVLTPDMSQQLVDGLNKKIQKANADIHLWTKMICELDCIEHKPVMPEFEEITPDDLEEYRNGN